MAYIKGDLSVMPLTDLLQWIDLNKKTGTLVINTHGITKSIYTENGRIIFISSNKEGERIGEFLHKGLLLESEKIRSALLQSQSMKKPFTLRLIELNYFTHEDLLNIISKQAKGILLDAFDINEGSFEFIQDVVPSYVVNGPISLSTIELVYLVFKELEDKRMGFNNKTG
jgi:hypothetical protein